MFAIVVPNPLIIRVQMAIAKTKASLFDPSHVCPWIPKNAFALRSEEPVDELSRLDDSSCAVSHSGSETRDDPESLSQMNESC